MNILEISDDEARKLFADLTEQREAILEKSAPLRAARDKFANEAREKELAMNAEIKAVEEGLGQIDRQRGRLVRLLAGKTGIADPA